MATEKIHVKTTINGRPEEFLTDPYVSLLDALREIVGLTGSKEGCLDGNCGACTVSVNGRIVDSCLVLAPEVEAKHVKIKALNYGVCPDWHPAAGSKSWLFVDEVRLY